MKYHVKQKVIVNLEFDIELNELTTPSDILGKSIPIGNYKAKDSFFTPVGDKEEELSIEIYADGETEYPQWTWERQPMLTLDMLKMLPPETIFATGTTTNDPTGIYMTDQRKGDKLTWIAVTGYATDWAIYVDWDGTPINFIQSRGDKIVTDINIKKLVPCTNEAYRKYRY